MEAKKPSPKGNSFDSMKANTTLLSVSLFSATHSFLQLSSKDALPHMLRTVSLTKTQLQQGETTIIIRDSALKSALSSACLHSLRRQLQLLVYRFVWVESSLSSKVSYCAKICSVYLKSSLHEDKALFMGAGRHVKAGTRLQDILPWLQREMCKETVSVLNPFPSSQISGYLMLTTDFSKDVY